MSYSDWKRELADTDKAETFARFCRRWWVVAPSELAKRIQPELPPAWGLLGVTAKGVCRELQPAPARDPETIPPMWWVGWLAQTDRRQRRLEGRALDSEVASRVDAARESWERTWESKHRYEAERSDALREQVAAFEKATGINITHGYSGSWDRWAALARVAGNSGPDLAAALARAIESLRHVQAIMDIDRVGS